MKILSINYFLQNEKSIHNVVNVICEKKSVLKQDVVIMEPCPSKVVL